MKFLTSCFLFILFLTPMAYATNFMAESKIGICDTPDREAYGLESFCEITEGENCLALVDKYDCATHIKKLVDEDDPFKPINSKNEIESCLDFDDCLAKRNLKICSDTEETPSFNDTTLEVFCTKHLGFEQKKVLRVVEDPVKKAIDDADKTAKAAEKADNKSKRQAAKALTAKLKSGTDLTPEELRDVLLAVLKELRN